VETLNLIEDMVGIIPYDCNKNETPPGGILIGHLNVGTSCNYGFLYWKDKRIDLVYIGIYYSLGTIQI
jgi:hypothetical protein